LELVDEEIARLRQAWQTKEEQLYDDVLPSVLGSKRLSELDRFDRVQLADVIEVCRKCRSLSEAGRILFAVSRKSKKASNDADRLKKYLSKYYLTWEKIHSLFN
jgi:transcriptional regulatory protein RtcR